MADIRNAFQHRAVIAFFVATRFPMKKIVLSVLLLPLGFSPLAHAACGGTQVNIPPVLGIDNNREYGRIWMNYNRDNDTYCTTMTLRGPRENKPTLGRLNHYVCAAGLNASGNCAGAITRASQEAYTRSSYQFGPIRVGGNNGCVKATGTLSFQIPGGATRSAFGQTPWKCFRP